MAFIQQAVAGAVQYDATTTALGLIQFDMTAFLGPNWVPRIQYLSLTLDGAAATALVAVGLAATGTTNRAELIAGTANSFLLTCPLTLGKGTPTTVHEIFVTTTGKTGPGILECVWFPYNAGAG